MGRSADKKYAFALAHLTGSISEVVPKMKTVKHDYDFGVTIVSS